MAQSAHSPSGAAIRSVLDAFTAAYNRGDAAAVAELYTEDGAVLPANHVTVRGRPAIQEFWQGRVAPGARAVVFESLEIEAHGNTATEVGRYTISGPGGALLGRGKYIVIWKRRGGRWQLHRDMMNSSLPAPK